MAKLTAQDRRELPAKDFAGPGRSFPVNDRSHAQNALARASNATPAIKARVTAKVHRKYPDMGKA